MTNEEKLRIIHNWTEAFSIVHTQTPNGKSHSGKITFSKQNSIIEFTGFLYSYDIVVERSYSIIRQKVLDICEELHGN